MSEDNMINLEPWLYASFDHGDVRLTATNENDSVLFVTSLDHSALTKFLAWIKEIGADELHGQGRPGREFS